MPDTAQIAQAKKITSQQQEVSKDPNFYAEMFAKMTEAIFRTTQSNLGM